MRKARDGVFVKVVVVCSNEREWEMSGRTWPEMLAVVDVGYVPAGMKCWADDRGVRGSSSAMVM
jgi:hypothetical protein